MEKEKQKAVERERLEILRKQELEARKQAEDEARAVLNPSKSKFVGVNLCYIFRILSWSMQICVMKFCDRIRTQKRKQNRTLMRVAHVDSNLWKRATIVLRISLFDRENRDLGMPIHPNLMRALTKVRPPCPLRFRSCKNDLERKFCRKW